jgi:hypothetical protein
MLKINLLPAYYRQRKLVKYAIVASVVMAALTIGIFVVWNQKLTQEIAAIDTKIQAAMPDKNAADQLESEATSISGGIAPLKSQVQFCDNAVGLGMKWAKILENAAEYTHASVPLDMMEIRGSTLVMHGHTPNLRTAARYLLNALRNPEWTSVAINGPPGYPGAAPGGGLHSNFGRMDYGLSITAGLKNVPAMPSPPGGATSGGSSGGPGGGPGGPGGSGMGEGPGGPGGPMPSGPPPGAPSSGNSSGGGNTSGP